ncbi:MAG: right-handed parallel beta-helix repeat-containing protein [Lentisphaeria bacterium]|nr:right-handed parallel beta-helix repeat-containing protein [Lentisphaeria bacterium]
MNADVPPPIGSMRPVRAPCRIRVTVGGRGADFAGRDDKAIQGAMDYVSRLGGGTVVLSPGVYVLRNALVPSRGLRLRGSGSATVLRKAAGVTVKLIREADWFEYSVQVADASAFRAGSGVALSSGKAEWPQTRLYTVTRVDGNVLHLSRRTEKNFWPCENGIAQSVHSLIHGWDVDDVAIEDLVLDGNGARNPPVNGNYAAGVFLQHCNRWVLRNVVCQSYNGDGFSFQVCDDIRLEECKALGNANLGFHPGSGSQRPVLRRCEASGNGQGLFWCWGVCDGLADRCVFSRNRVYGVNFGHRDTDNVLRRCRIEENGDVGVVFRREVNENRTPDRNRVECCTVRDNGRVGIEIQWITEGTLVERCRFRGRRGGRQATAIRIAQEAGAVQLRDNRFDGDAVPVCDERSDVLCTGRMPVPLSGNPTGTRGPGIP